MLELIDELLPEFGDLGRDDRLAVRLSTVALKVFLVIVPGRVKRFRAGDLRVVAGGINLTAARFPLSTAVGRCDNRASFRVAKPPMSRLPSCEGAFQQVAYSIAD